MAEKVEGGSHTYRPMGDAVSCVYAEQMAIT